MLSNGDFLVFKHYGNRCSCYLLDYTHVAVEISGLVIVLRHNNAITKPELSGTKAHAGFTVLFRIYDRLDLLVHALNTSPAFVRRTQELGILVFHEHIQSALHQFLVLVVSTDDEGAVCLEVADAKDMQELQDTYYKYEKKFKNNKYFINAVNQRKSELEAA